MNPLANPYVRIALGAVASTYLAPKIINRFVRAELNTVDAAINTATSMGITAAITSMTYIVLGMAFGKSSVAAAASTGGSGTPHPPGAST